MSRSRRGRSISASNEPTLEPSNFVDGRPVDYRVLVGGTLDGHWFHHFYGTVYQVLRGAHAFVESQKTGSDAHHRYVKAPTQYIKKNGEYNTVCSVTSKCCVAITSKKRMSVINCEMD